MKIDIRKKKEKRTHESFQEFSGIDSGLHRPAGWHDGPFERRRFHAWRLGFGDVVVSKNIESPVSVTLLFVLLTLAPVNENDGGFPWR